MNNLSLSKIIRIIEFVIVIICAIGVFRFFIIDGYEYKRELKAEKTIVEYLAKKDLKQYDDYSLALVKSDRYFASARTSIEMWVIFKDEPNVIYTYYLDSNDALHVLYIHDLKTDKNIEESKHDTVK